MFKCLALRYLFTEQVSFKTYLLHRNVVSYCWKVIAQRKKTWGIFFHFSRESKIFKIGQLFDQAEGGETIHIEENWILSRNGKLPEINHFQQYTVITFLLNKGQKVFV